MTTATRPLTDTTVLVIEDDELVAELLATALVEEGYGTLTAYDGARGLEAARQQSPQLVLLDLAIPEVDGHHLLRELERYPETANIPVIVMSGYTKYLEPTPQVVRVIQKPVDMFELAELVDLYLGR